MGFKRRAEKLRNGVVKKLVEQPFEKSIKKMVGKFTISCGGRIHADRFSLGDGIWLTMSRVRSPQRARYRYLG